MKIIALYAAMAGFDHGLNEACKIIYATLTELGMEVEEINLAFTDLHYYDGISSASIDGITEKIKQSAGVIFASSAQMAAPCAVMQTFIEYLDFDDYREALRGKCCLTVTSSKTAGEREAAEYISKVIAMAGGYDALRIPIGGKYQGKIGDQKTKEMIEKYVEDYYRYVRQNREFFVSSADYGSLAGDFANADVDDYEDTPDILDIGKEQFTKLFGHEPRPKKINPDDISRKLDLEAFTQKQEQEIGEIAKILSDKYDNDPIKQMPVKNIYRNDRKFTAQKENVVPRIKTCRQRTQSLEHYYNHHVADGLEAVFQFHISGEETFDAHLIVSGSECACYDGVYDAPSISIYVDSKTWTDVLSGKYTAQKAFMTGQLKVRGNFVLLTRFDQVFKKEA